MNEEEIKKTINEIIQSLKDDFKKVQRKIDDDTDSLSEEIKSLKYEKDYLEYKNMKLKRNNLFLIIISIIMLFMTILS